MAVSIGLTVLAFVQRHEANEDKRFAQAQALTAAASESLDSDPLLSTQLARAAVELSHTLEAEAVLHRTLAQHDHRTLLQGHGSAVGSAAFSPNGERVVTASQDATARIWDAESGDASSVLRGHDGEVEDAAFNPDGSLVVTASRDGTARIWDAASEEEIGELSGHTGAVYSAAFNRDGERVVTASQDGTARIWDVASEEEIGELSGHTGEVTSAAFNRDGERVVTASQDGTARIWPCGIACVQLTNSELVESAEALAGDLDHDDSARYLPE